MSGLDDDIVIKVLQTSVLDAVAASAKPNLPVKMLGRTFDATAAEQYLEVVVIPNNRTGDFWGKAQNYQGLLRLILHWQNDDSGVYEPIRIVKSIASYFDKDKLLYSTSGDLHPLQIYENPSLTGLLEEKDKMLYPVSIRYRSFRPAS